ncbi:hypothetical protein [Methylobacterium sp. J-092]|uniref:hypothetical protein n=1 Tax=Methylobacterium sp. J-092 TaxID=2836667 RepID=UPI001FBA561F|nr:hypothetical protein [Methylobacterium sp. J-092]MCJ2009806.1 hypothetical protein [Methylobacterium sp. J-092]
MFKLTAPSDEPVWLDLVAGVRIRVRPATVAAIVVAQAEAGKVFRADGADADPDTGSKAGIAMVRSLARFAIVEWEGVGDEDSEPAAVTPQNVEALMRVWPAYDAFDRRYATPALSVSAEKNA